MNNITVRCTYGTTDSYETREVYPKVTVDELIKQIRDDRERNGQYRYNLYQGGEQDSTMPIIKCYRPGFIRHDCIKLQFTGIKNCREFEESIKELFAEENFSPRKFIGEVVE